MDSQFDVSLEDLDLAREVELTVDLMIAASEFDRPLTDGEIDQILGVTPLMRRPQCDVGVRQSA